jgi:hypothetical protein
VLYGEGCARFQSLHLTKGCLQAVQSSDIQCISAESEWFQLHFLVAQFHLLSCPLAEGDLAEMVFMVQGVLYAAVYHAAVDFYS